MSIFFDEINKTFFLESKNITYAFFVNKQGLLRHLYFGKRLPRENLVHSLEIGVRSCNVMTEDNLCLDMFPTEFSTFGYGDFHEVCLSLERDNDRLTDFKYSGCEIFDEKPMPYGLPAVRDGKTLAVTLTDKSGIDVILYYTVCEDAPVITRRMAVINRSDTVLTLARAYSFNLDLPKDDYDAVTFDGGWACERSHTERIPLHHGIHSTGSKRGASSHPLNPFMMIADKDTCENYGNVYGFLQVYSGSWEFKAEVDCHGKTRILGGINDFEFSWKLEKGEKFETPEVIMAFSSYGFGELSRGLHDLLRNHLINPNFVKAPRPVVINNWEATYFDFNTEKLKAIVSAVKGSGIDTLVLDDGWFGARYDDVAGLGDWVVNDKLGGSFEPIISFCKQNGMKFGLWIEPEMVNPDSDLYRTHPDWAVLAPNHNNAQGRHQHCLDLTRSDVRDYIVNSISEILKNNDISYIKWDCNRNIATAYSHTLPKDRQKEFYHRYILGLYDICERLVNGFPNILFEGCSGGGGRFDAGILYYFPQVWTSDNSDAFSRTSIQYNTSFCYPLSSMSCHISICPNHQTGRSTPFSTRADIAHLGATGYELDTTKITNDEIAQISKQVRAYRDMERLVLEGDLYRLSSPESTNRFAVQLVSKDKSKSIFTVMEILYQQRLQYRKIYLQGLDENATYSIPELELTASGASLMYYGIMPKFRTEDFTTLTFHINKI